jgi:hypothetical protein
MERGEIRSAGTLLTQIEEFPTDAMLSKNATDFADFTD